MESIFIELVHTLNFFRNCVLIQFISCYQDIHLKAFAFEKKPKDINKFSINFQYKFRQLLIC